MDQNQKAQIVVDFFADEARRYATAGRLHDASKVSQAIREMDAGVAARFYDLVESYTRDPRPSRTVTTIDADKWDEVRDQYRREMLEQADTVMSWAIRAAGGEPSRKSAGAIDADLPEFFKGLDAQFERAMVRAGIWRGED